MNAKKLFIFIVIIIALIAGYRFFAGRGSVVTFSSGADNASQPKQLPAINGLMVDASVAQQRPLAVMVENHPDARPQSGLADADLVYETLAEGGITRFMAVYQTKTVANIGPIRSARTYFADLANELGAVYAHVGGNSDVLANLKAGQYLNIADADQFFNGNFFHRITSRSAPHNVYSSTSNLDDLAAARDFSGQAKYGQWKYKDDSPLTTAIATLISINFSLPEYAVRWQYDQSSNTYQRFLAGIAHIDLESKRQILAKNVIAQFVKTYPVQTDTVGSIGIDLTSGGQALVFMDGNAVAATWKKQDGRTRYFDQSGNEISLNRGQTWIEMVPVEKQAELLFK